jgi:hypothetical protein
MKKAIISILISSLFVLPCMAAKRASQVQEEATPAPISEDEIRTTTTTITDAQFRLAQYNANLATVQLSNTMKSMQSDLDAITIFQEVGFICIVIGVVTTFYLYAHASK